MIETNDAAAITAYITLTNTSPKPFVWTKTADHILASIVRFAQRTFAIHGAQHISRTTGTGH